MSLGIITKKKSVSLGFKYLQTRFEIGKLVKDEGKIKDGHKHLKTYLGRYDLDKTRDTQGKINKFFEESSKAAYKLSMNNFILLRMLILNLEEVKEHIEKLRGKKENMMIGLEKKVDEDLELIRRRLKICRNQLNSLLARPDSGKAYGMFWKEMKFLDVGIWNYFVMKQESKAMIHQLGSLIEHKKITEEMILKLKKTGLKKEERKKMTIALRSLVREGRAVSIKSFKLFTNTNLLLHVIINILREEEIIDHKAVKSHIIPQAMGEVDLKVKQKIEGHIIAELRKEEDIINQEWRLANE